MIALRWLLFELTAAAVLLLPGALLARRSRLLWNRLEPGERILPAFLLSVGSAGVVYLLASVVRPTVGFLVGTWLVLTAALLAWNVAASLGRRRPRGAGTRQHGDRGEARIGDGEREARAGGDGPLPVPGGWRSGLWGLPVVLAGCAAMAYEGGALGVVHDSLEFVAFVKRMLLTSRIDLVSGAFRDVADLGSDPRRGVFHFLAVILCRLSGASAVEMWRWLPAILVPLALWTFYASFRRILQSATAALAALAVFFVATLFSGQAFLNNLAYASRVGWVYSWVGLWAAALYLDAAERKSGRDGAPASPGDGSRGDRLGFLPGGRLDSPAAAFLLAIAAAPILLGVHVYSAAQYLVALGACAWSWALLAGLDRRVRRDLLLLPLWALLATAPLLWLKVRQSYSDANPLFGHAQGLLYIAGDWAVLSPNHLKSWFGWPGLLALLLTIPLVREFRRGRDRAFLAGSTLAVVLVVLDPVAVRLVELAGAHSVLFRILLVAPWFQVLGWHAARALGSGGGAEPAGAGTDAAVSRSAGVSAGGGTRGAWRAAWRWALIVLVVASLGLHVRSGVRQGDRLAPERADWMEFPAVQRALGELERIEPEPAVVGSDPLTSYIIPAFSRHYAIAPFGQHSSPADGRTVERIQDARAVLNPIVGMKETVRLLRKYDADCVLLNQTVRTPLPFYYAPIDPGVHAAQREKFLRRPDLFRVVWERDLVWTFRFLDPGPAWRDSAQTTNPYRAFDAEQADGATGNLASRGALAARLGVKAWTGPAIGGLELIGVEVDSLPPRRRGESLTLTSYWRRTDEPYVLPVAAFIRLQTAYPDRRFESAVFGRLYRAWYESRHWISHRFGRDIEPLGVDYPAFLWERGAVYRVPLTLPVLVNARRGRYSVGLLVRTIPFEPNLDLRDLFTLRDSREGIRVGEVTVIE